MLTKVRRSRKKLHKTIQMTVDVARSLSSQGDEGQEILQILNEMWFEDTKVWNLANPSTSWRMRCKLGLKEILERLVTGEEFSGQEDALQKLKRNSLDFAPHVLAVLNLTVSASRSPMWLLSQYLVSLGLKLKSRKIGPRGKQVRWFSLRPEHYPLVKQLLETSTSYKISDISISQEVFFRSILSGNYHDLIDEYEVIEEPSSRFIDEVFEEVGNWLDAHDEDEAITLDIHAQLVSKQVKGDRG